MSKKLILGLASIVVFLVILLSGFSKSSAQQSLPSTEEKYLQGFDSLAQWDSIEAVERANRK